MKKLFFIFIGVFLFTSTLFSASTSEKITLSKKKFGHDCTTLKSGGVIGKLVIPRLVLPLSGFGDEGTFLEESAVSGGELAEAREGSPLAASLVGMPMENPFDAPAIPRREKTINEAFSQDRIPEEFYVKGFLKVHERVGRNNKPLLIKAVKYSSPAIVAKLLREGADVNAQGRRKEAALHYAAKRGNIPILILLLQAGAERNIKNYIGVTPLNAVSYNPGLTHEALPVEIFELIVALLLGFYDDLLHIKGPPGDLELADTLFGYTPLLAATLAVPPIRASCRPSTTHIEILSSYGASREHEDKNGKNFYDHRSERPDGYLLSAF